MSKTYAFPLFRVWIDGYRFMFKVLSLNSDGSLKLEDEIGLEWPGYEQVGEGVHLMQSLDARDADGVELFEGDIIIDPEDKSREMVPLLTREKWYEFKNEFIFRSIRKVGNIYENPELLEEIDDYYKKLWAEEDTEVACSYQNKALSMLNRPDE